MILLFVCNFIQFILLRKAYCIIVNWTNNNRAIFEYRFPFIFCPYLCGERSSEWEVFISIDFEARF